MRVTQNTNYDTVRDNIQRSKSRMEQLQTQSATLKKLNTPSDNPVGAARVLEARTDKVLNEQFGMNSKLAETYLNNSEHAVEELSDIVMRAKELAISQSSGASSNEDTRLGIAEEVSQLYQQAIAAANRRVGDRFLFGGFKTQRPPIDGDGKYQGDDGQMMVEVARDVYISMNMPGMDVFNTNPKAAMRQAEEERDANGAYGGENRGPSSVLASVRPKDMPDDIDGDNVNVFDELQNLRIAMLTNDLDGVRNTLERFDQLHAKLVSVRAKLGSRAQGLDNIAKAMERHNITNAHLTSNLEDADMAQVMSDLAKEETIFKSALASSTRLIHPTLLDFLK